jgi:hypothetical protein
MFVSSGLGEIVFADWVRVSLLPVLTTVALTIIFGYLVIRPQAVLSAGREVFTAEYQQFGPIKRQETVTGLVLVGCFILFASRSLHGLPDAAVCCLGFVVLCIFRVIRLPDISTGISWDLTIFIGATMGFGAVFEQSGLAAFLTGFVTPAVSPIAGSSPGVFVLLALVVLFLWRFVDIATFVPTFAIVTTMLPGFAADFGISPLIWLPVLCLSQNTFFMSYTNLFALTSEQNAGDRGWDPKTFSRYGLVYAAAAFAGIAIALPYWQNLGLL